MLTAFLSYKYDNDESESLALSIADLLRTLDVNVVDGKKLIATDDLNAQIKRRIDQAQVLIAIQLHGHTSQYIAQEAGYALGKGIKLIIIADNDSAAKALHDQYLIRLEQGLLSLATDLIRAIVEIKTMRVVSLEPTYSQHSSKVEIESEGWTPEILEELGKLRELISSSQFAQALELADEVIDSHSDCWRAYIAKSACLTHLYRYQDARMVLDKVVNTFPSHRRALSHAYQNIGWVSERSSTKFDAREAERRVRSYRKSISLEPREAVFNNLIYDLLTLDRVDEAEREFAKYLGKFHDAREKFSRLIELQGADFVRQIAKSPLLLPILFPRNKKGGDTDEKGSAPG